MAFGIPFPPPGAKVNLGREDRRNFPRGGQKLLGARVKFELLGFEALMANHCIWERPFFLWVPLFWVVFKENVKFSPASFDIQGAPAAEAGQSIESLSELFVPVFRCLALVFFEVL